MKKLFVIVSLVFVLTVVSLALGACSHFKGASMDMGKSFPAGSGNNPYVFTADQAPTCPSWGFIVPEISGKTPWCVSALPPALHTGDLVKLDNQLLHVSSVDPAHHRVTLTQL